MSGRVPGPSDAFADGTDGTESDGGSVTLAALGIGWLDSAEGTLREFAASPTTFVIGLLLVWLVNNFIIKPTAWGIATVDWAYSTIANSLSYAVKQALGTSGTAILTSLLGGIDSVYASVQGGLQGMGLGAPIAAVITTAVFATVVTVVVVIVARVVIDVVPGGGGLIR